MDVYRILKEPYWHDPLSVTGASIAGGRWNPPGKGILYTATSPALALLETLVHFPRITYSDLPGLRIFTLKIPDQEVRWLYPELLPDGWAAPEAITLTQTLLSEWLEQPADLGIGVPSAVLTMSYNVLLHPDHTLYQQIQIVNDQALQLDRRLWHTN